MDALTLLTRTQKMMRRTEKTIRESEELMRGTRVLIAHSYATCHASKRFLKTACESSYCARGEAAKMWLIILT